VRAAREFVAEEDYDVEDDFLEDQGKTYGSKNVGSVHRPYLMLYIYKRRFVDTLYCIRKDGDIFKMGVSAVVVDTDGDITIKGREYRGWDSLWELGTRKKVDKGNLTSDGLT
jgi:hypothetical protein